MDQLLKERRRTHEVENDSVNEKNVISLFRNIIQVVQEVEDKGIKIVNLTPAAIYVKEGDNSVRILLNTEAIELKTPEYSIFQSIEDILYSPPEQLEQKVKTHTSNWWSVGIMLYENLFGIHPFYNENAKIMKSLIKRYPAFVPSSPKFNSDVNDVLRDLLNKDHSQRMGTEGVQEILTHPFFQ
mmetsp:Transcript_40357/g.38832  ORF Transcript_40357/g.38832 Transcript_40357/m.38832 type:complete len:184 (-) Transcript_40357:3-554(-)